MVVLPEALAQLDELPDTISFTSSAANRPKVISPANPIRVTVEKIGHRDGFYDE